MAAARHAAVTGKAHLLEMSGGASRTPAAWMPAVLSSIVMGVAGTTLRAETPRPSSCLVQPDKSVAVAPASGRAVYCGLDLGSRSIKLTVLSVELGRNTSVKEERQCRRSLGLGAQVF